MSFFILDTATSKQIHDRVGALMPEYDLTRLGSSSNSFLKSDLDSGAHPRTRIDLG